LGERLGIDGVAFAEDAERPDERLDLAGVGTMRRAPGGDHRVEQSGFIAAGCLAHDQGSRIEAGGKGGQRIRPIGQAGCLAAGAVEDDDLGLADIAADKAGGNGGGIVHPKLSFMGL